MLIDCLSASKEEKLVIRKLCSYGINLEVEGGSRVPAERVTLLSTGTCPALSLFTACPKSPRGQNQDEDQPGLQNPVGTYRLCDTR